MREKKSAKEVLQEISVAASIGEPFIFALDYELEEGYFSRNPKYQQDFLYDIRGESNVKDLPKAQLPPITKFSLSPITEAAYSERFAIVRDALLRGDSFLANLTIATEIECNLTLPDIFGHSIAPYRFFLPGRFVSFSPERFVHIDKTGRISSNPMKGTIDASLPQAAERLLADYKESAEHSTIVDLIRNDLSRVSTNIRVDRFRYLERIETNQGAILQMSSCVSGKLPSGWQAELGEILAKLLPAGSISGAPKESTCQIIRQAECGEKRGFYTGVAGYFDGEELDSAVLIRYIEETPQGLRFRSGGGITINSQMHNEYEEILLKVYLPQAKTTNASS